jgi:hypothetical protein
VIALLLLLACGQRTDHDRDGFGILEGDCDDQDETVSPVAPEVCNGRDDDCDGEVDEDAAGGPWFYPDADGDGYGLRAYAAQICAETVQGWAPIAGDCDDSDPDVHPGAEERCNGTDDDCDGIADERAVDAPAWHRDADGDGWGDPAETWESCTGPEGWVEDGTDCDDSDPDVNPGADETCFTAWDDDCDGSANDPGAEDCVDFFRDADGDGYAGDGLCLCTAETPWTATVAEDCDDSDPNVHPGATELYDLVDDDCDGVSPLPVATADARLLGSDRSDYAGFRVVGPGDLDGDGLPDLAISAHGEDAAGTDAGAVYVVAGQVVGDFALVDASARLLGGAAGDAAGVGLARAGDTDGDGLADLVVGAYYQDGAGSAAGAAYVVQGPVSRDLSLSSAAGVHLGVAAGDYAGWAVAGGQDEDGDGLTDVLVGAWGNDEGYTESGVAYLLHGPADGTTSLADADAILRPTELGDRFGYAVALGADRDGDGLAEVIVGAYCDDTSGSDAGAVYLYTGPVIPRGAWPDARLLGETGGNQLGYTVDGEGDYDGDGHADLAIGAYGADFLRANAGAAYVVTEAPIGERGVGEVLTARIAGPAAESCLYQVAAAGDVDGDGRDDLLLGARYHDDPYTDGGGAWLLYGPVTGNIDLADGGDQVFLPEAAGAALGVSLASAGDLDGDGFGDLILGAYGAAGVTDAAGAAYVVLGGGR